MQVRYCEGLQSLKLDAKNGFQGEIIKVDKVMHFHLDVIYLINDSLFGFFHNSRGLRQGALL